MNSHTRGDPPRGSPHEVDGGAGRGQEIGVSVVLGLSHETDDDEAYDSNLARALHDRFGTLAKVRTIKMAVRVREHQRGRRREHVNVDRSPRGRGLLTLGAMPDVPSRETAFLVFAQRADARIDIQAWGLHAERFFATRIGLADERPYPAGAPAARFVVAPTGAAAGIRSVAARPRDAEDLSIAADADALAGGTGLALLARRCDMVWLVSREGDADTLALRLAAILAGVLLGPILDTSAFELFGVKTARAKLERMGLS
jgi:hypothetical protein